MGRTYLNENRLEEALEIYSKILQDYPDDVESLLILGNIYLASGDGKTAKRVYQRALELQPNNPAIRRQLLLAEEEQGLGVGEPVPTDPEAVARLLQRLTGKKSMVKEADILKAAEILEEILQSPNPAEIVASRLDEIDDLLLALIELNVRQAQSDGKPELAEGLRNLQIAIELQSRSDESGDGKPWLVSGDPELQAGGSQRFRGKVLFLNSQPSAQSSRMKLVKSGLDCLGCQIIEANEFPQPAGQFPDVAIVSNPHIYPKLLESLASLTANNVPIILDLDTDFELLPVSYPEYSLIGLGTPARGRAYMASMLLASLVTVTSDVQAQSLRSGGYPVSVVPDGWTRQNPLWEKKNGARETINIGWLGSSGQLEDLAGIRRVIIRILREFPYTQIVITGNPQSYRLFESVPENRRKFLPPVAPEENPYLLSQLDILLVPLHNHPYNQSLSDKVLVEAGVKQIPWIASPIPAFQSWQAGGIIADTIDEWHLNLRQLVIDAEMRKNLGKSGFLAAKKREMSQLGHVWLSTIENVLETKMGQQVNPGSGEVS
ncbi:MAG: tetratricopeptide repeat protein [Anaerolineaceae bacterium]|nr:tetratricopeptide repeat protein [Anaerolineaceae bacterium]